MILFTSNRPLDRAENLKSVFNAYDGPKEFARLKTLSQRTDLDKFDLQVTDELPNIAARKCIFIGHGMGAGKTYGLQMPNRFFYHPELITYAIASSEDMIPIVARYCGIPEEKVIPLGMPRTDAYFVEDEKVERPYRYHLYAPTFRSGPWQPDWNEIHWNMPKGHKLMVKPHMVTGQIIKSNFWDTIETYSPWSPSTPFLKMTETVITDYSSIMFDAMVLRKPVILFAKDKDRYLSERGMYNPYPKKYSKYFFDKEADLAKCLEHAKWDDSDEELRTYYAGACDGHSVKRTLELMRSVL